MPSVVYYVCSSGGDDSRTAAQAQNPSTPWATAVHAMGQFASLNAGEAIAFCRGGTFTPPGTQIRNSNGTQSKPTIIRDYTQPGRAGMGDPRPIFNGESFNAGIYPGNVKFENFALHASAGTQAGIFDFGTNTDVTVCNVEVAGTEIGIQFQYQNVPQELVRHSVIGSRVLNSVQQGFLGHSSGGQILDNYWYNNPTTTNPFNHTIYLDGHSLNSEANFTSGEVVARNEIHSVSAAAGVAMVVGGIHKSLTVEDNQFLFDIGSPPLASGWGFQIGGSGYGNELMYTQDLVVRGNTVINSGNQGFGVATCKSNCLIENNLVINTVQTTRGINAPSETNDSTLSNNITIRNNTVYTPVAGSIGIMSGAEGTSHLVANNVVQAPTCYLWQGAASAYTERDYNACYQGTDAVVGSHAWKGDPKWKTPGSDFRPASGSPLIGAGDPSQNPATDLDGTSRPSTPSIGAFEP